MSKSGKLGKLRYALIATSIVVVALASIPAAVSAHARLTSSDPAPGSALGRMPATIRMDFSESVDPGYSSASLLAADGSSIPIAAPVIAPGSNSGLVIAIPNAASVQNGVYTLVWRVLSATDGHVTSGTLAFSVGSGSAPVSSTGVDESNRPPWWRIAIRWLEIITLVSAAGGFFFMAAIDRTSNGRTNRAVLTGICAAIIGALLLSLHDQTIVLADRGVLDPPPLSAYRHALFDASGGHEWIARFALAFVMLVCSRFIVRRFAVWFGLASGLAALLTRSASGHAAGVGRSTLAIAVDWLHLTSVSLWFGGLVFLALTLRTLSEPDRIATLLSRFSKIALVTVLVLIATGLTSAAFHVAGTRSLTNTDYGIVLIAKHLLFVPALVAAGANLLLIVPRLKHTSDPARASALAASARRLIWTELAFVALVLVAAGALTELAPADGPLAVDVASRITTINQSAPAGDLTVQLIARLTGEPEDRFIVSVTDDAGQAPAGLQRLIVVSSDSTDTGIGDRFDAQSLPGSSGSFFFPAVRIGLATTWNLNLIVRRAGVDDATATLSVDVRAAAVQPPRLTPDHWSWPRLTIASYALAPLALILLVAGIIGVRRLPGLEPIAGALILTMTGLIAAGFLVQAARSTVPVTAGAALVNPASNDPGAITQGAALYAAYCLACHGAAGEGVDVQDSVHSHGDSAGLLSSRVKGAADGDLFWYIGSGVAGTSMPAFDHALSDGERWDLVQYLRALQRSNGQTPAPGSP